MLIKNWNLLMIIWDGESSRKFIVVKFLEKYLSFAYDGYKLIEERNALDSNVAVRKYVWQPEAVGLDVPLSMTDVTTAKNYAYTLDANKNVSDLTDAQGNVVAHYEYSPFGTHTATGSYTGNPFRFSSEVFDSETGLIYYNYRYYNPSLGRWINRDPIEEEGGWNLYGFVKNDAIVLYDLLGKRCCGEHVLSAGQKCCMNKYPYTPKKQCCKNNMLYNSDFLTCLTNCIERHSLSNLLGGLLAANSTINGLYSKPYKTGTTGKSTGWLSKLGGKIKVTLPFRFMNTNNLLRAIGRLGVAMLVADGFYTSGLFLSCRAICVDDPCSF